MSENPQLEIRLLTLGIADTNCIIVGDKTTGEALVIDPVDDAPLIIKTADEGGFKIKLILATHGHFDHILASKALKEMTSAPFFINQRDLFWLENLPEMGLRFGMGQFPEAAEPDGFLTDESEMIQLGSIKLETIFAPGHSPGHICFYMREHKLLFGGDVLFAGGIGRTDLPGGDYETLMKSIFEKLIPLGDDVRVLPGHGDGTTIGDERRTNSFLLDYAANL